MFSCGFGDDKFIFMYPNVTAYYISTSMYSFVIPLKNMN